MKKDSNQELYTDLYTKNTDTNNYLRYDSAHPPKCKQSLLCSQYLRLKRICKNKEDYEKHKLKKRTEFLEKGYPKSLLDKTEEKVGERSGSELLTKKESVAKKDQPEKVFRTTTYRPGQQFIVRKNWDILARSSTTRHVHQSELMIGYKRPKA